MRKKTLGFVVKSAETEKLRSPAKRDMDFGSLKHAILTNLRIELGCKNGFGKKKSLQKELDKMTNEKLSYLELF